jgi:glycosyltransferase involved in cell wall biosynthesis
MTAPRVLHLSSHHQPFDNRIFARECRSLAAAGYAVGLVCQHEHDETVDGVRILAVPPYRGRLDRLTRTAYRVFRRALAERAALYHFHDPELIPWGLLLRLTGRAVVFDVHEDYATALAERTWLPPFAGRPASRLYDLFASLAARAFEIVIAERYYARRFPGAVPVLNYPRLEKFQDLTRIERPRAAAGAPLRLLYTGSITASRGALIHAGLVDHLPLAEVHLLGQCSPEMAAAMRARAQASPRLTIEGIGRYVPHARILAAYRQPWTAALALLPDTPHYREKELTKLFEYMAAGIPIVCSDFPVWRELVEGSGAGIAVDPTDPAAIVAAIAHLQADPLAAQAMGAAGRRAVEARFNWASQERNLLGLYRSLLGAPEGRPDTPRTAG